MKDLTRRDFVKVSAGCSTLAFWQSSVFGGDGYKGQELAFSRNDWKGQWIWDQESKKNSWVCFRKDLNLDSVPKKAVAKIAVDSKYWLWINGKMVVYEGGLNRGPVPGAGYYDAVDLKQHLKNGRNVIAVLGWYWGNSGRNNSDSGKGGLLFQAELDDKLLVSDKSWKTLIHPAYGGTKKDPPAYLYGGHNIGFDGRKDIPDWMEPGFDDMAWGNAAELGLVPCKPWNTLERRPIPLWKDYGLKSYESDKSSVGADGATTIVAELPYSAMISPYIEVDAPAGLTIDIRTDRHRISGGPGDNNHYNGHHVEYIARQGSQSFECLNWLYGEKVIYTIPKCVKIISLKYRETGYNCDFSGSFKCDDQALNTLWEKSRRTLYICMRDNYMDCPDRERGQWIGDVSLQVIQTFYCMGRSVDKLTVKCIDDFIRWQKNGVLRGNVPGTHCSELPSQSLHAISDHGIIYPYYMYTGDIEPMKRSYTAIMKYLKLWKLKENGLVLGRRGNWRWFDHLGHQDKELLENCWYYAALKSARDMGQLINRLEDKPWLDERITGIENVFDKLFWKSDGYRDKVTDERANAMAVVFGLASKDKYPVIRNVLVSQDYCTPYIEAYVLEALFIMGYAEDAYKRMKRRYDEMIKADVSTLWEDFSGHGTLNHAWSGAPLSLLSIYGAGIAPLEPAWKRFSVLPQMGPLKHIKMLVPSVKGDIKLELKNQKDFTINLTSPENTTAVIGIPDRKGVKIAAIRANGKLIWKNGKSAGRLRGAKYLGTAGGYVKFAVDPGNWSFVSES